MPENIPLQYLPVLYIAIGAVGLGISQVVLGYVLGPKRPSKVKLQPYECGIDPIGPANIRLSVKYYVVALLFLIFDVEGVLLYLWAIVYDAGLTFAGPGISFQNFALLEMSVFVGILFVGYLYLLKKGALDWT